jgi:hypothetical protein
MYDIRQLQQEKLRYEQHLGASYRRIRSLLTAQERSALAGVRVEVPLIGGQTGSPFDFYTMGQAGRASIFLPVLSLRFLEDMATAYAWLEHHNYSLGTLEEYITMLRVRNPSDFPGRRYPPPLDALRIPSDALFNEAVKSLALSLRDEAYSFIMLHELGHALYRSRGANSTSPGVPRPYEAEADLFALTVLERADTIPMGIVLWFKAQIDATHHALHPTAEARVQSEQGRQTSSKPWTTHLVSADRLSATVRHLHAWGGRLGPGSRRDRLIFIAERLTAMANGLGHPERQGCTAVATPEAQPATLTPDRLEALASSGLVQTFCEAR